MYPAPEAYLKYFPEFVKALGGGAFEFGTAYFIGNVQAAALWLPPGAQPDEEALMDLFHRSLPEQGQRDLFAIFQQMGNYHPHEPHWYLPLIGVDPIQQRKGYGSILLAHALRECDMAGTPAYLSPPTRRTSRSTSAMASRCLGPSKRGPPRQLHPCFAIPVDEPAGQ